MIQPDCQNHVVAELDELKIPNGMRPVAEEIIQITDEVMRADLIAENPVVWFVEVDGLVVDSRSLPIDYQVMAFQRGLIPCIPALGPDGTAAAMAADADPRS